MVRSEYFYVIVGGDGAAVEYAVDIFEECVILVVHVASHLAYIFVEESENCLGNVV